MVGCGLWGLPAHASSDREVFTNSTAGIGADRSKRHRPWRRELPEQKIHSSYPSTAYKSQATHSQVP